MVLFLFLRLLFQPGCFFDFFVASYCTCFRSFDLSMEPLWRIVGFAGFSASDNLSCLYQWGSCTETGNEKEKSVSMPQHLNNQNKTQDISMQDKSFLQMKCIFFTIYMRCILIGPIVKLILMHQGFACDQYHSVWGQIQWSKMPSSSGHNCSGTAITVLHSRLVSPSSCSFLPHTELNWIMCVSLTSIEALPLATTDAY